MVSVVVVGYRMSGKTTLVASMANIPAPESGFRETCGCNYVGVNINGQEWHVWDTPYIASVDSMSSGWMGEEPLKEADVVVVCHAGHRDKSVMELVRACGVDRTVIAMTRGRCGREDYSYAIEYLCTTRSNGTLVHRAYGVTDLIACVLQLLPDTFAEAT